MHCCDLVEVGALLAMKGPDFVRCETSFRTGSLETYWAAARCRLDRWGRFLKDASSALNSQSQRKFLWKAIRPGLEEILASELLTRVVAAAGTAHDQRHQQQEAGPVMASILTGHLEARRRTLELLVQDENPIANRLNRLRRRVERWTDLSLAHLTPVIDVERWAFDAERARQFALDLAEDRPSEEAATASAVLLTALRTSFSEELSPEAANPDLNEQLAAAIFRCLPRDFFRTDGVPPSPWLARIDDATDETQGMLNQLLSLEDLGPSKPYSPHAFPPTANWFGWN